MRTLFSIPINQDKSIVYAPLRGVILKTGAYANELVQKIESGEKLSIQEKESAIFKTLQSHGVLQTEKSLKQIAIDESADFEPTKLTIIPTEGCNLGCTYCYASAVPRKDKISWELVKKGVDQVIANTVKKNEGNIKITFYGGGEPTIHFDLLQQTVEYAEAKAQNLKVYTTIVTNGTLLDETRVKWLRLHGVTLSLSFDVLPDVQHFQRPYANGKNSHKKVMKTIELLQKHGVKFGIRATVTENNLLSMVETVDFIHEYLPNVNRVQLEPSTVIGRSFETGTYSPYQEVFVKEFLKAYEYGKKLGVKVRCSMSDMLGRVKARACMPEFTVTSNNTISACHRYSKPDTPNARVFTYGQFSPETKKWEIDQDKYKSILKANVHNYAGCKDCFARFNCAGDCLSTRVSQDKIEPEGQRCYMVREFLKASLLEKIENS